MEDDQVINGVPGTVVEIRNTKGLGLYVKLEHQAGVFSTFNHMKSVTVGMGEEVPDGGLLGYTR